MAPACSSVRESGLRRTAASGSTTYWAWQPSTSESKTSAGGPYFRAFEMGRSLYDDPGGVAAGSARKRCLLQRAPNIFDVAWIDSGGTDLHNNLACGSLRLLKIANLQIGQRPEFF